MMKPGDLVGWKFRLNMDLPSDIGIILERITVSGDQFPFWKVFFGERGILQCRESDLGVIK